MISAFHFCFFVSVTIVVVVLIKVEKRRRRRQQILLLGFPLLSQLVLKIGNVIPVNTYIIINLQGISMEYGVGIVRNWNSTISHKFCYFFVACRAITKFFVCLKKIHNIFMCPVVLEWRIISVDPFLYFTLIVNKFLVALKDFSDLQCWFGIVVGWPSL
jgi:hypothetical protein